MRIHEHAPVDRLESGRPERRAPMVVHTDYGRVAAPRVVLATNASPSPLRRLRRYTVPVYDYVLMTEPFPRPRPAAIGWERRQGVGTSGNQFLYYRRTADHRILFGGYDAIYHYGSAMGPALEQRAATFTRLSSLFARRSRHSRTSASPTRCRGRSTPSPLLRLLRRSFDGRVASVAGYTGLGVGASRFGARVALDLVSGTGSDLTRLAFVRSKPIRSHPSRCGRSAST